MRSATRLAILCGALAGAACGNYSTEDLAFLEALPTRADLAVEVPAEAAASGRLAQAAVACDLGPAAVWGWARPASDGMNASVDWVLGLVDAVRRVPPTERFTDGRIWGPFESREHPGTDVRVVMLRAARPDLGGALEHTYAFEARPAGAPGFAPILAGSFVGPSAVRGTGSIALDFDAAWAMGLASPDAPRGRMEIRYDRRTEPRTVRLSLLQGPGFGLERFDYAYAVQADGSGRIDYAFRSNGDLLTVTAGFTGAGAGRDEVVFFPAAGGQGSFRECWDAVGCLSWVDDPGNYSCGAPPCSGGDEAACPAVPGAVP